MHRLEYIPGAGGESLGLDGPLSFVGTGCELRGSAWEYDIVASSLVGVRRAAREVEIEANVLDAEQAEAMSAAFDADMSAGTPGEMVFDGEWRQRCYVSGTEVVGVYPQSCRASFTVALLDGVWGRWRHASFAAQQNQAARWLDFPHDFEFDFGATSRASGVSTSSLVASPVRVTVFGQAVRPQITIGGNLYAFDVTVPGGSRLVCDGTAARKTIEAIDQYGTATNAFECGRRGSGAGGGSYCFEPLPPGRSQVSWTGAFGFDLDWLELRGGLPWM